jgi:hypothetical protein
MSSATQVLPELHHCLVSQAPSLRGVAQPRRGARRAWSNPRVEATPVSRESSR